MGYMGYSKRFCRGFVTYHSGASNMRRVQSYKLHIRAWGRTFFGENR